MEPLLRAVDLALVHRLHLAVQRSTGQTTGEQRSPALGGGIEFADYREYLPGDDIRQVDWAVFLRFRKLVVKLAAEERELSIVVVLDTSASMGRGTNKFLQAQRLTALLGGIALATGNRLTVYTWGSQLRVLTSGLRGVRSIPVLAERLGTVKAEGRGQPVANARAFAERGGRCWAVLVSDLLHPQGLETIAGWAASGAEAHVLHLLSPEEWDPPLQGEITVVDDETGEAVPLHFDAPLRDAYRQRRDHWCHDVEEQCRRLGVGYARVRSDNSTPRVFDVDLRKAGWVW